MPGGMLTITFRDGRKPPHPNSTHPRLKLSAHLIAAAPPASVDWYGNVADWPMYLNDQLGCCTEAMVGHKIENASTYGAGKTVEVADSDVLKAYERVGGYVPGDPSTDNGAVLQDVYGDWRRTGVGGHKILAFAQVDHTNLNEVKQAVASFGAVGLGIVVSQQMMDDFNAGKGWTRTGGGDLGGHAVPVVGYDAEGVWLVTWAAVIKMTWALFAKVVDESWIAVLPEWFAANGQDPDGLDLYGLGEELASLTGEPNPFQPAPQPVPTPTPTPVPPGPAPVPVDAADQALADAARPWLEHRHAGANRQMAKALLAWLDSKHV